MAFPTLATKFEHEVLGNEYYCSGYTDSFNLWNSGFYCPQTGSSLAVYCCGTPTFKYCCTIKPTGLPDGTSGQDGDDASIYMSDTPVIIAIACGILAVVILIVSSCFFCSCCFIHKKLKSSSTSGGMYRMEESSTTSFHPTQNQSLLPNNNVSSSGVSEPSSTNQNPPRPIISIQPQQTQAMSMSGQHNEVSTTFTSRPMLSPAIRSNSLGSNSIQQQQQHQPNWNDGDCGGEPHQTVFHINSVMGSSHPGMSSSFQNNIANAYSSSHGILPPPARFSSNQNLTSYNTGGGSLILGDRSNPREVQKLYEYGPTSSPYILSSGEYLPSHQHHHQYGPISPYTNHNQYFPSSNNKIIGGGGYCTSTLPSSLRRSGSGSTSITSVTGGGGRGIMGGPQPLKSILRNPLNPQNSTGSGYQYVPSLGTGNTTPIRSCTPMSMGSGGGGRRVTTDDFDFGESLLASGSGSDEHSYNSYNFPDYTSNKAECSGSVHPANYSPGPVPNRRFSNTTTEYQNDINRLDSDLDPESLSRLIELDLDSKL